MTLENKKEYINGIVRIIHVGVEPGDVPIEVSVVMPCLNEADTLAICIE